MNQATFGRLRDSRNLMLRNLAVSVILYESVTTTQAKARSVQPLIDKAIGLGKSKDRLTAYRELKAYLPDEKAIVKILDELTKRYEGVNSGFTRRYSVTPRSGDGAPQAMIQLTKNARLEASTKPAKEKAPVKEKA